MSRERNNSKGNHKQNEKTIHRMGGNPCKWSDQQGINLQNIERAYEILYPKKNFKMGRSKQTFFQRKQIAKNAWEDAQQH